MPSFKFKNYTWFLIFVILISKLNAQDSLVHSLNLIDAINLTLENHPNIKILKNQEKIADIQTQISQVDKMPTINFSASDFLNFGRSIDPASNTFVDQQVNSFNSNLNVGVTIYEGNKKNKQIFYDQKMQELAKSTTNKTALDLKTELIPIFLQAYYFQEEINAQKDILKEIISYHEKQKELWKNQVKSFTDTLLSYSRLLDQQNKLNSSINNKLAILEDVFFYVQKPLSKEIKFEISQKNEISLENLDNLEVNTPYFINKHPEMLIQNQNIFLLKQKGELLKTNYYPKLSAWGSLNTIYSSAQQQYSYQDGQLVGKNISFFNQIDNNFRQSIGLELSIPLNSFYQTPKQLKKIDFEIQRQEAEKEQVSKKIIYQFKKSIIKYQQALQEYNNYQAIEIATAQTFYAIDEKVKRGLSNWFEWFQILNDWQNKKINLLRLKISYLQEKEKLLLIQNLL